jgi:hypothetical protein
MSKELVKKKDYTEEPGTIPGKAIEALRRAFDHEIPRIVDRLNEVIGEK